MPTQPSPSRTPATTICFHAPPFLKQQHHQLSRCLPSSGGLGLLPRHLLLHPPPRLQDHLVAPLLQQRLAFVLIGAPLLRRRRVILRGVLLCLQLVLQVEALYQVRLSGLVVGGSCGGRGGRGCVRAWGRWRLEGDGWLVTDVSVSL